MTDISKPMLNICTTLLSHSYDLVQTLPGDNTDPNYNQSVKHSINLALGPVYLAFLTNSHDEKGFTKEVIHSMYLLLNKAKQDLEERVNDVRNIDNVPYAILFCVDSVHKYMQQLIEPSSTSSPF